MDSTGAFQIRKVLDVDWQEAGIEETRDEFMNEGQIFTLRNVAVLRNVNQPADRGQPAVSSIAVCESNSDVGDDVQKWDAGCLIQIAFREDTNNLWNWVVEGQGAEGGVKKTPGDPITTADSKLI